MGSALEVSTRCPSRASGLSKPHPAGSSGKRKFGEHPRVLVSSSRAPSNPFSIIKQAKPKNSAELYYMWQDNLRGEQGTKCPRCPNLPPRRRPLVGTRWEQGPCQWGAGYPAGHWGFGESSSAEDAPAALLVSCWGWEGHGWGSPRCVEEGAHVWAPIPAPRLLHLGTRRWSPKEAGGPATRPTVTSGWE